MLPVIMLENYSEKSEKYEIKHIFLVVLNG